MRSSRLMRYMHTIFCKTTNLYAIVKKNYKKMVVGRYEELFHLR